MHTRFEYPDKTYGQVSECVFGCHYNCNECLLGTPDKCHTCSHSDRPNPPNCDCKDGFYDDGVNPAC